MFEELLTLVGDSEEAKAAVAKIKASYETTVLERDAFKNQFETIKEEKERYKKGNQLVKETLGLDKISEDALKEKLEALKGDNKGGKNDEAIAQLKEALTAKENEISSIRNEYEQKFTGLKLDTELANALNAVSDTLVDDKLLRDAFKNFVAKDIAVLEDGVYPVQTIGDQKIPVQKDGKPLAVADYLREKLNSDEFASFRKPSTQNGAGTLGGGSPTPATPNLTGSGSELEAAVAARLQQQG